MKLLDKLIELMTVKSTTNFVTVFAFVMTAVFVLIAMLKGIKEVDPVIVGFWSTLLGFVVGAKSSKSARYSQENNEKTQNNDAEKILDDVIDKVINKNNEA